MSLSVAVKYSSSGSTLVQKTNIDLGLEEQNNIQKYENFIRDDTEKEVEDNIVWTFEKEWKS